MLFWKTVLVWNEDVSSHRDSIPQPLAWFVSLKSRFFWVLKITSFFSLWYYFQSQQLTLVFKVLKVVSLISTTIFLLTRFLIVVSFISESTQNCRNFPISELDSFRNSPKNFRRNDFLVLSHFSPNSIFSDFTPASSWNGSVHAPFIWAHSACLPSLAVPLALHPLTPFHCLGSVCIWRPSAHALAVECSCCCWLGELRGRVGQRQVGFLQIGKEIIPKNHGVESEDF